MLLFAFVWTLLGSAAPAPNAPPAAWVDDKFIAAQKKFLDALRSDDLATRRAALDEFVALGNPDASSVLVGEFGRTVEALRDKERDLQSARFTLERCEAVVADLTKRAERDATLKPVLERETKKRTDRQEALEIAQKHIAALGPWRDGLSDAMTKLFEAIGPSKRKKAELDIWKDADENPDSAVRIASVELLGRVGGPGTAVALHDLIVRSRDASAKLDTRLKKSMADVREMEQRLQRDSEQNGGRVNRALEDQYNQVKKEGAEVRRQVTLLELLCDTAVVAGGRALSRETGPDLEKSMQTLVGYVRKTKDPKRLDSFAVLTHATGDAVRAQTRSLLEAETDAISIAALIEGLAELGDKQIEQPLITRYLVHENWLVRSRAASGLAKLRSRDAIPVLIARLDAEQEGRVRTDVSHALRSLTAKDFHGNLTLWQRWWKDNGASFVVAPEAQVVEASAADATTGVSFFGIETDSKRVLFVLDLSGSMNFAMIPRNNPDDDPNRPPDNPVEGESSRLQVAKRDLLKALSGLKDGGLFNLVLFASDVETWSDDLVTMDPQARSQVAEFIEKQTAVGGTNIYGALERALDMAGAKSGNQWSKPLIDTIYVLTDGKASVGLTTDTEEILAFVRERNKTAGITIHTIGLSNAHDPVLLRRLAEENGGSYVGR